MAEMIVRLEGEGAFRDEIAQAKKVIHLGNGAPPIKVAALPGGMVSGRTAVALGIEIPGGEFVVVETALALFGSAADMIRARYGNE